MAIIKQPASNKATPNYFATVFLSNPATAIPKGAQWIIYFDNLPGDILPAIDLAYKTEPEASNWRTKEAASVVLSDEYQRTKGCLFCQAISLPGEGGTPVAEGIKMNGFIRSHVGAGRNDFPVMRMTFIDTNISFTDTFLRGWSLATAKYGMIARGDKKKYRTGLTCEKFSISPKGAYISQRYRFEGICCIAVSEEEYNYDPMSSLPKREAQFIYHSYSVNAVDGADPSFGVNVSPWTGPNLKQLRGTNIA